MGVAFLMFVALMTLSRTMVTAPSPDPATGFSNG
jgi:hypothetical protein